MSDSDKKEFLEKFSLADKWGDSNFSSEHEFLTEAIDFIEAHTAKKVAEAKKTDYALLRNSIFNAVRREFKFEDKFKRNNAIRLWELVCKVTREFKSSN